MSVNTHNLPMTGIKEAAGKTRLPGVLAGLGFVQISYDLDNGKIYSEFHVGCPGQHWVEYWGDVCAVCNASVPMAMQEIADKVSQAVEDTKALRSYLDSLPEA